MSETQVVLMSGGLDSTTVAAMARAGGAAVHPLLVDYGQRHAVELRRAVELAAGLGCLPPVRVQVDLRAIGGSALTADIAVPKDRSRDAIGRGVPATYVPCRNLIMLSLAFALAEQVGADAVGIGVNALDYSGYPDCRPAFVAAFAAAAPLAMASYTEGGRRVRLDAPLIGMGKAEILALARSLAVPVDRTWSCYDPQGPAGAEQPCGRCDSCILRAQAEHARQ